MFRIFYILVLLLGVCMLTFLAFEACAIEEEAVMHELENRFQSDSPEIAEYEQRAWRERLPANVLVASIFLGGYVLLFWQLACEFRRSRPWTLPAEDA